MLNIPLNSLRGLGLALLIIAIPLHPMLQYNSIFNLEWINHLWSIEYFRYYMQDQHSLPATFDANPVIGIPVPIFYGFHLYTVLGPASTVLGSYGSIVLMIFLLFALQFFMVHHFIEKLSQRRDYAWMIAGIVTWAIYPLTNIYHRAAFPEFIGSLLGLCSLIAFFHLLFKFREQQTPKMLDCILPAFLYTWAALVHPLTAIYMGGFVCISIIASWWQLREPRILKVAILSGLASAVVLSPWLLAIFELSRDFTFVKGNILTVIPGIDSWWARLLPFAYEWRTSREGIISPDMHFPYHDVQVNLPLLLLATILSATLLKQKQKSSLAKLAFFFFGVAISLLLVSSFQLLAKLAVFLHNLQFAYRLINYINISLLLSVALAFSACPLSKRQRRKMSYVWILAVSFAFTGLVSKLLHAYVGREQSTEATIDFLYKKYAAPKEKLEPGWYPGVADPKARAVNLSRFYYGHPEYSIEKGFNGKLQSEVPKLEWVFLRVSSDPFGKVLAYQLSLNEPTLVITNIQAFPWNRLLINGTEVPKDQTLVRSSLRDILEVAKTHSTVGLSVMLPAGEYLVDYRFHPNPLWRILWWPSTFLLVAWCLAILYLAFRKKDEQRVPFRF